MSDSITHTSWHKAVCCAIQIDLKDYSHLLEYQREYLMSSTGKPVDMLVIKKQPSFQIPKHIASIFKEHNLFEIKGHDSSLTTDAYYKTNGHAGHYIDFYPGTNTLDRHDISLTFPTFRYPQKLFKHLTKDCNKTIEKPFPGVYYITKEMYATQVLVISELSPEDSLFLHCLTKNLNNSKLINSLTHYYDLNKNNELYTSYMNQFLNSRTKGDPLMVCEGIFKLYGTSSKEVAENASAITREQDKQLYLPQIEKLTERVTHLEQLLTEHNIAY